MMRTLISPRSETTNKNRELVCEVAARCWDVPRCRITGTTRPREDLGADSLDILDLLTELEQEFAISLPDEAAEQMERLDDVLLFLASSQ